jgi:biotin carboxyl carrier protein
VVSLGPSPVGVGTVGRTGGVPSRRRGRLLRPLLALLVLAGGAMGLLQAAGAGEEPTAGAAATRADAAGGSDLAPGEAGVQPPGGGQDAVATRPNLTTPPFATIDGLVLHLPSEQTVLVGFHEASQSAAMSMDPVGTLVENANPTRFSPPAVVADGTPYVVLSSRGRLPSPTSAVDLVMRDDDPVRSPVDGTVVDVRPYSLYSRYPDHRVEIAPADRPDLRVVLIHIAGVGVRVGDVVTAGETILAATANRFPFGSHVDRYTEPDRWPHVHVEVKPASAPRPGDG